MRLHSLLVVLCACVPPTTEVAAPAPAEPTVENAAVPASEPRVAELDDNTDLQKPESDGISAAAAARWYKEELGKRKRIATVKLALDAMRPTPVPLEGGRCYLFGVRLGSGVLLNGKSRNGFDYQVTGAPAANYLSFRGAYAVTGVSCVDQVGPVLLSITPKDVSRVGPTWKLGKGEITVEIYQMPERVWPGAYTRAELDERVRDVTRGMARERKVSGTLDRVEPLKIQTRRGRCYALVMRLHAGAKWSSDVASGKTGELYGVRGPGAVNDVGCQLDPGDANLIASASPQALGTGTYDVEVFSRGMSARELKQLEGRFNESAADTDRWKAQHTREGCAKCRKDSTSKSDLEQCARILGLDSNACY